MTKTLALCAAAALVPTALHLSPVPMTAPAHAKKEKGPAVAAETFIHAAPIASGVVRRFLVNPHGEVDALLLTDGTIAKFPPHMGGDVTATVKTNDAVSLRGYREPGGTVKAYVITNEGSKQQVVEHPAAPQLAKLPKHLRFAALSRLKVAGTVERQMRGKKGEVNGVLLADGTVLRFPGHAAFDLAALLQPGQSLAAEGLGTENQHGRNRRQSGYPQADLRPVSAPHLPHDRLAAFPAPAARPEGGEHVGTLPPSFARTEIVGRTVLERAKASARHACRLAARGRRTPRLDSGSVHAEIS